MKHFTLENNWDAIKGQLKQRYAQLTDDDLTFISGKGEELLARLREKLSLSEHDLEVVLDDLKAKSTGIADEVRAKIGAAVDDVKTKGAAVAEEVKTQAEVAYNQARRRARTLREDGEEYVRHNPRETLFAALCAGFVAGLLLRR